MTGISDGWRRSFSPQPLQFPQPPVPLAFPPATSSAPTCTPHPGTPRILHHPRRPSNPPASLRHRRSAIRTRPAMRILYWKANKDIFTPATGASADVVVDSSIMVEAHDGSLYVVAVVTRRSVPRAGNRTAGSETSASSNSESSPSWVVTTSCCEMAS